ncbi:MAG: glycosyltransferase family 4 protein [Rhodanobacter sp.]
MNTTFVLVGWLAAAFLLAAVLARLAIGYALGHGLLDLPGQRRSHYVVTPRGGGIGIVAAVLVCVPGALFSLGWVPLSGGTLLSAAGALLLVALTGWWDDHRSLPVLPRLGAHVLAVAWFSLALLGATVSWWWLPLLLLAGVWSINLHNFMDGIDGILAQQTVFVAVGLAALAWTVQLPGLVIGAAVLAAAALGFWCYNRPPARIFMGDVGSGSLGLLIFAGSAMLWRADQALLWPALILSSAFVTDASLTLLTRMYTGRRWYAAHREHLYQWLVRCGRTHARVDGGYFAWNILIAAPFAWLAWSHLRIALPITIVTYLAASALWLTLKRRCLRRQLLRARHVTA